MKNKKRIIYGCLVVLWCVVIFCFSNSTADNSSNLSFGITQQLVNLIYPKFSLLELQKQTEIMNLIHLLIRKMAHMSEYAILFFLIFQYVSTYKTQYFNPLLYTVIYALTDEFHQLFIQGRSGNLLDVCIDGCGAILMMAFIHLYRKLFRTH